MWINHVMQKPCKMQNAAQKFLDFVNDFVEQLNDQSPSCLLPLFQSESKCKAYGMKISFVHM